MKWILALLIALVITSATYAADGKAKVYAFWQPGCIPCRQEYPIWRRLILQRYDVKYININLKKNQGLIKKYNVTAVPTTVVIHTNGHESIHEGFTPYNDIVGD